MIKRSYFVAYAKGHKDGRNTIGSLVYTVTSFMPKPHDSFCSAADYIKETHDAVITNFQRIK